MTQVILNPDDYNHHVLLQQWDEAGDVDNALYWWREANPQPDTSNAEWGGPVWDAYRDWCAAEKAEEQRLGLNTDIGSDDYDKGRIKWNRTHGSWILRLRKLTRNIDDEPTNGDRVVQCPRCNTLFATFSQHDHYCTDACRAAAQVNRDKAKAKRRKERQSKRSEALASRTGTCLACGNQFTLKRITAKTCSEACRKRLQRKPELAGEYLQPLSIRDDHAQLKESEEKHSQAVFNLRMAQIGGELTDEQQDLLAKCEAYLDSVRPVLQQQYRHQVLNAIAGHAPALGAWLMAQTEETQKAACLDWEGIQTVLGPALRKKLQATLGEAP